MKCLFWIYMQTSYLLLSGLKVLICAGCTMQFGTKTSESFFSWDWYSRRSKAVQKHKQTFQQYSGLGVFFLLREQILPLQMACWCGFGAALNRLHIMWLRWWLRWILSKISRVLLQWVCKESPKNFTYRWSSWSWSLP